MFVLVAVMSRRCWDDTPGGVGFGALVNVTSWPNSPSASTRKWYVVFGVTLTVAWTEPSAAIVAGAETPYAVVVPYWKLALVAPTAVPLSVALVAVTAVAGSVVGAAMAAPTRKVA